MASSCLMYRSNLPDAVFSAMEYIMTMVLDESDKVPLDLLKTLLSSVRKENQVILFPLHLVLFCLVMLFISYHSVLFIKEFVVLLIVSDCFIYFLETGGESYRELFC